VSAVAAGLAALVVALVPATEPPPPPYDWDATPVQFEPFWVYGGPRTDGHVWTTPMASNPAEGRALCEFHKRWDYPNDALWGCKVVPYDPNPVFGPQWGGAS
jgi:hypothetical protein